MRYRLVFIGSSLSLSRCFYLGLLISAILNLVNLNIRQALKVTISLVLYALLSNCVAGDKRIVGDFIRDARGEPHPESWNTGKNHYEPTILTSNKNMIRIKYLSVGSNAEHEQVKQLILDHCQGTYIETSRVELRGYDTVEAECTHDPVSLQ
jgi:hypothetical protein